MPSGGDAETVITTDEERVEQRLDDEAEFREVVERIRRYERWYGQPAVGQLVDFEYDATESVLVITAAAPTGTRREYRFEHGDAELGSELDALLDYLGTDRLADAIGDDLPMMYTDNGWQIHLPTAGGARFAAVRSLLSHGLLEYGRRHDRLRGTVDEAQLTAELAGGAVAAMAAITMAAVFVHPLLLAVAPVPFFLLPPGAARLQLVPPTDRDSPPVG